MLPDRVAQLSCRAAAILWTRVGRLHTMIALVATEAPPVFLDTD